MNEPEHLTALRSYQQADEQGVMVKVSRQAIHETLDQVAQLTAERDQAIADGAEAAMWFALSQSLNDRNDRLEREVKKLQGERKAAVDLLRKWEAWEADLILSGIWTSGTLQLTQEQHDELTPLQQERNRIINKHEGSGTT